MRRSVRIGFLGGLTLGAALTYFLDPLQGRRRREIARDRASRGWRIAKDLGSRTTADLSRSTEGARCRLRSLVGDPSAADDLRAHRDRSRMERFEWDPATRLLVATIGTGAFVRGRRRGGLSGLVLKTVGLTALTRSIANVGVHRWGRPGRSSSASVDRSPLAAGADWGGRATTGQPVTAIPPGSAISTSSVIPPAPGAELGAPTPFSSRRGPDEAH